jgi:hypothetical protein
MTATINASTSAGVVTTADTSGILQLQTNGTAALTVDASQNVGIGTASPTAKLEVVGSATATRSTSGQLSLKRNATTSYSGIQFPTGTAKAAFFGTPPSSDDLTFGFDAGAALTEAMRIDSSGNVGIGTSSPSSKLHVVSSSGENKIISEATAASQQASISLIVQAATPGQTVIYMGKTGATTNGQLGYDPINNAMSFYTNNSERMRITSAGDLLVGTTSTDITAVGIRLRGDNIQVAKSGDWSLRTGRTTSTGVIQEIYYNSSRVGDIATNGTGATYNSASDYRLKEDIVPMTGALARNALLNPVKYKWKIDGSEGEGFVADQLQGPFPSAVTGKKDAVDADGNPIYQSIGTGPLDGHFAACVNELTAAIQEQQALITQLQADVAALKGQA